MMDTILNKTAREKLAASLGLDSSTPSAEIVSLAIEAIGSRYALLSRIEKVVTERDALRERVAHDDRTPTIRQLYKMAWLASGQRREECLSGPETAAAWADDMIEEDDARNLFEDEEHAAKGDP